MSRVCDVCGKEPLYGNNVSHSHKASKRRWLPNLQRIKVKLEDGSRRLRVCTSCIRTGRVEKAV
ncbi:MAG: 50S ribosomal protein L28 [Candidatus Omnitrophota bacterium]